MNYLETITYIDSLAPTLEKPSLTRIAQFLSEHGNPQDKFPSILVGGTNGKGSAVAMLDSILREAGLTVGRFTGPHLLRWNERFHVSGRPIGDEQFAKLATDIRRMSELFGRSNSELGPLTWFEFLAAISFFYFAQEHVDIAVVEVGLGGRFDATNTLSNVLSCAITNVSLDHTHILGDSLSQIAFEKAGIIKAGIPVVTGCTGEALDILISRAKILGASVFCCTAPDMVLSVLSVPRGPDRIALPIYNWQEEVSLPGEHQITNALLALVTLVAARQSSMETHYEPNRQAVCDFLRNEEDLSSAMLQGLKNVYWPGRMQFLPHLNLLMDGAHNPSGALALRTSIDRIFGDYKKCFVVSCYENKNVREMIGALVRAGDRFFVSEAATRRKSYPKESLASIAMENGAEARVFPNLDTAFAEALENRDKHELIIATGSFATVRELMLFLGWSKVEDGQMVASHKPDFKLLS